MEENSYPKSSSLNPTSHSWISHDRKPKPFLDHFIANVRHVSQARCYLTHFYVFKSLYAICHLPSSSPAQRLPSGHPNMKYCLEIRVMLTEELGAIPPPSPSWTAPLVEDMLCKARTGLTKAVVKGPGRAVLFYGRHSMGEGLRVDEARDPTFLLTRAGMWVGKLAYLTTDPMTIHKGRRAIAQAVSDNRVKARGPRCPHVNLLAHQPFHFNPLRNSPPKDMPRDDGSNYPPSPCRPSRGHEHNR